MMTVLLALIRIALLDCMKFALILKYWKNVGPDAGNIKKYTLERGDKQRKRQKLMVITEYKVSTGSITESFIKVKRFTVPVYPDNDGNLYYRDPETYEAIIVEE